MDKRALAAVLSFCTQIAAGVAPVKWPQYTLLADSIFWGACLVGIGCTLWWLFSNYRLRSPLVAKSTDQKGTAQFDRHHSGDPQSEALDKVAYNQIVAFCIDHLLPSCAAQVALQESITRNSCNETLSELAIGGLHYDWKYNTRGFWENYTKLSSGLADSPGPTIRFDGIIECVHELEREFYKNFCEQGAALSASQNMDVQHGPAMSKWNKWRDAHLKMVKAYEPIKRDIRFGKLHRLKLNRWGEVWGQTLS